MSSDFEFDKLDLPMSEAQLRTISDQIKSGIPYVPRPTDVQRVQDFLIGYERFVRRLLVGRGIPLIVLSILVAIFCVALFIVSILYIR